MGFTTRTFQPPRTRTFQPPTPMISAPPELVTNGNLAALQGDYRVVFRSDSMKPVVTVQGAI
jgi:hypothetical protein